MVATGSLFSYYIDSKLQELMEFVIKQKLKNRIEKEHCFNCIYFNDTICKLNSIKVNSDSLCKKYERLINNKTLG